MNDQLPPSRLLDYLRLLRAPNVFTAIADVAAGFMIVRGGVTPPLQMVCVILASAFVYTSGMVLNDVFDIEIDRRERPKRPLPSGRIDLKWARWLGFQLLAIGVVFGWLAGFAGSPTDLPWRSGTVVTTLAGCVLLYDGLAKKTALGPFVMGSCRFLNLLLGMSVGGIGQDSLWWAAAFSPWQIALAVGMGLYIVGVTWFARSEAEQSPWFPLYFGVMWMLIGLFIVATYPLWTTVADMRIDRHTVWPLLIALLSVPIMRRCGVAILDRGPGKVQSAVKLSIMSLVMLNAASCFAFVDGRAGVGVLSLLVPMLLLGRWVYST